MFFGDLRTDGATIISLSRQNASYNFDLRLTRYDPKPIAIRSFLEPFTPGKLREQ